MVDSGSSRRPVNTGDASCVFYVAAVELANDGGTDRYLLRERTGQLPQPAPAGQTTTADDNCWTPVAEEGVADAIRSQSYDAGNDRFLWYLEEVG